MLSEYDEWFSKRLKGGGVVYFFKKAKLAKRIASCNHFKYS